MHVEAVDRRTSRGKRDVTTAEPLDPPGPSACPPSEGRDPCDRGGLERELEIVRVGLGEVLDTLAPQPDDGSGGELLDDALDVVRGGCERLVEPDGAGGLVAEEGAVEHEHVEVRVQPQIRAETLEHGDGACLCPEASPRRGDTVPVGALDHTVGDAKDAPSQVMPPGQEQAEVPGQGEDPLANGDLREDLVHHAGGERRHAPATARRTEAATLAGEGHEAVVVAGLAAKPGEARGGLAAPEVAHELPSNVGREPTPVEVRLGEEGGEVPGEDVLEDACAGAGDVEGRGHGSGPWQGPCRAAWTACVAGRQASAGPGTRPGCRAPDTLGAGGGHPTRLGTSSGYSTPNPPRSLTIGAMWSRAYVTSA